MNRTTKTISVVIPCYRSELTIGKVVDQTRDELVRMGYGCQFVLVNDCSPDGTYDVLEFLASERPDVQAIDLARNFGQHAAIMCGLHHATGDVVVLMDDDMQTHPSQLEAMIAALTADVDVVFGRYPRRREALWRRFGSAFWRWTMRVMTGCPKGVELSSFVVMRGWVAREMARYSGPYPVVQGLVFRVSSRVANANVAHFERESGTSGYTLRSLVKLWSNVINFSMAPLRAATLLGTCMGATGLLAALYLLVRKLVRPDIPVGWSSTMVTLLTCAGLVILSIGVVGEYVGRVFMTANGTPQFVERDACGGGGFAED